MARPDITLADKTEMHAAIETAATNGGAVALATILEAPGGRSFGLTVHGFESREMVLLASRVLKACAGDHPDLRRMAEEAEKIANQAGLGQFLKAN